MRRLAALLCASLFALPAFAHDYTAGSLKIDHPWSRAMPVNSPMAAAFMSIENKGHQDDRLLSASSPQATRIELHTHLNDNGVMRMREVSGGVILPAGKTTKLAPGGLHIMFMDVKKQAKAGDKFPLTLQFEKAGKVEVVVNVEQGAPAAHAH